MLKYVRIGLLFLTVAAVSDRRIVGGQRPPLQPRVVAIADIHGDFDAFLGILQRAQLADSSGRWTGKNATLVQTGDFTDRGPKVRAVMDLLMSLQKDAPKQGGRVVVLMGNHEAMNIYGDLRYVTPNDYTSFTDNKSGNRRQNEYKAYAELAEKPSPMSEPDWMKAHPAGFVEHRDAFGPDGKYGKWLRNLPAIARVNDSIFLHGGINPELSAWKIEKLNEAIAIEIKAFDAYKRYMIEQKLAVNSFTLDELAGAATKAVDKKDEVLKGLVAFSTWLSIHPDGPLWFRGYAQWSDSDGAPQIQRLIEAYGVARFVVGHTPQAGEIVPRFGGKVFLADTGMLSGYFANGRASALNIQNGKISAIYSDSIKTLN